METLTNNSLFLNTKIIAVANGVRKGLCVLNDGTEIAITRKNEDEIITLVKSGQAEVIYTR